MEGDYDCLFPLQVNKGKQCSQATDLRNTLTLKWHLSDTQIEHDSLSLKC